MKIACPECNQPTDRISTVEGMIQCLACSKWFADPSGLPAAAATIQRAREIEAGNRSEHIRNQAENFTLVAAIFVVVGILALLAFGFSFSSGDGGAWGALDFCGASFGIALWLYLIAQIIHIRANTEK